MDKNGSATEDAMSDAVATHPLPRDRRLTGPPDSVAFPTESVDEHDLYPVHEEDEVPEIPLHERQVRSLIDVLSSHLDDKWVTGNVCMYWEKGNMQRYVAPDVLVVDAPSPEPLPPVYLRWADPPPLLVVEVGSKSTFLKDQGPKTDVYAHNLHVPEYLYFPPVRLVLGFYRLMGADDLPVIPAADGHVHSETLNVSFGVVEAGFLRVYDESGRPLPDHSQALRERRAAEAQAEKERLARLRAEARIAELERALAELQADGG